MAAGAVRVAARGLARAGAARGFVRGVGDPVSLIDQPRRPPRPRLQQHIIDAIQAWVGRNSDCARALGVSAAAVCFWRKRAGLLALRQQAIAMPGEEWRTIHGYDGMYSVSNVGRVCSQARVIHCVDGRALPVPARLLSTKRAVSGHVLVSLWRGNTGKTHAVHCLVIEAFGRIRPEGMECRHLDGNPSNNHIDNLAWGTRTENQRDRWAHGTDNRGERHGMAKLQADDILQIRRLAREGARSGTLATMYGVTGSNIRAIVLRRSWKHLPDEGL